MEFEYGRIMDITIQILLNNSDDHLFLDVVFGHEFLNRKLNETAMNRPGLALTGFFSYFPNNRLQIFGLAELSYLKNLNNKDRETRLEKIFKKNIPGIVLTRNRKATDEILKFAKKYGVPILRTPMVTMDFINSCTVILEQLKAPHQQMQGTALELMGIGILLRGSPGIGKSETALALIQRGYSLVSDDITEMCKNSHDRILCWANDLTRFHMEIRGLGIIHVPSLFGVRSIRKQTELDLVIDLENPTGDEDRTGVEQETIDIMGINVPLIRLPVQSGRDMANIVEVAALNHKLRSLGHDAAKELDHKIIKHLSSKSNG